MSELYRCDFCTPAELEWRTIRLAPLWRSIISVPSAWPVHCLVIPNEHKNSLDEVTDEEWGGIMSECVRLTTRISTRLGNENGTEIRQKSAPGQIGNGVAMVHPHIHVIGRREGDPLFTTPTPNSHEGFYVQDMGIVQALARQLHN